ncbi:helix-turn-helix domain-containing protein [Enterococcus casseliflavus]|uniref:helix-turn-helix domain-containing protein n=1 Tax=Enterococcus casseliflavus TaxID=37734 RepID=UPI0018836F95|nr:helix-turn-helix domain-containing protein [Enterococcus casseliflavus]MBE9909347.1 hypothetical protein [Enterococcus casseliflavus]
MLKLLPVKEQHLIRLLNLLENKTYNATSLQQILQINYRTLTSLIAHTNLIIAPIKIDKDQAGYYQLIIPTSYSIRYCYQVILANSIEFTIIKACFFEKLSLLTLSEKLFISESTLKRTIQKINNVLKEIHVRIDTKTMRVVGEETQVCNFIISLILEKYNDYTVLFDQEMMVFVENLLFEWGKEASITLQFPELKKIKLWLLVIFYRIKQNQGIPSSTFDNKTKRFFSIVSSIIFKKRPSDLIANDLEIQLVKKLFFKYRIFNYDDLNEKAKTNKKLQEKHEAFLRVITQVEAYFSISINEYKPQLLVDLCNVAILQIGKPYVLFDETAAFLTRLSDHNNGILTVLKTIFKENINVMEEYELNTYLYMLITHWPDLLLSLQKNQEKLPVSLVFDSDSAHIFMIKNILELSFPNMFLFTVEQNYIHLSDLENRTLHQLVITNIPNLTLPNKETICISLYPTDRELENIYHYYSKNRVNDMLVE